MMPRPLYSSQLPLRPPPGLEHLAPLEPSALMTRAAHAMAASSLVSHRLANAFAETAETDSGHTQFHSDTARQILSQMFRVNMEQYELWQTLAHQMQRHKPQQMQQRQQQRFGSCPHGGANFPSAPRCGPKACLPDAAQQHTEAAGQPRLTKDLAPTLSASLQAIEGVDPRCLFIVRRINKLGFSAAKLLKAHFAVYGEVRDVLLAHSTHRRHAGEAGTRLRSRPSSLGFVHMSSLEEAQAILSVGQQQKIGVATILVQPFERKHMPVQGCGKDDAFEDILWQRSCSNSTDASAVSTCASSAMCSDVTSSENDSD